MGSEVALISGEAIGAVENSEKIGQQVDQHSTRTREGGATRISARNDSGTAKCEQECGDVDLRWHSFSFAFLVK